MMKKEVSKVRAKKTKSREKQAGKTVPGKIPLKANPIMGLFIAFLLWVLVTTILSIEHIIQRTGDPEIIFSLTSDGAFSLLGLFAVGLFLKIVKPEILRKNSRILLLSLISLISLILAKTILYTAETTNWIPEETARFLLLFAFAPLITTILVDSTAAVAVGVWTSLVIGLMAGRSLPLFVTGLIATVVTAQAARGIRTRSKVIRIGIVAGLAEIACVFGFTALHWENPELMPVLHQAAACLISGLFSALILLMILPAFEAVFQVTTDITLLEWSDLSHPILQRLAIEAPGTYHHSLLVASLAQAAADEIGANSLLTRVSAYFHDIGKLTKPEFFAENIQLQNNPHDDLLPSMSTLVITSHVKEGLSLAQLHKLPEVIRKALREHHGTSLLSYFHHKAKSQLEFELDQQNGVQTNGSKKIDESNFRYPGPRPSSRETAIICLSDAIEAASRSMKKTTPGNIEGLVNDIVNTRLEDGQLDECNLTLIDLARIKRSFVFTLTNMFHGRVPYPEDENRDKQQAKALSDAHRENKKADKPSDGSGLPTRP
ncbi:HD family phosphohydrolase [Verrucomicrobiota bacterium]